MAELLLARSADVNARDKFGWTPLHFAMNRGSADRARLLLAKGGDTPVHLAAELGHQSMEDLFLAVN